MSYCTAQGILSLATFITFWQVCSASLTVANHKNYHASEKPSKSNVDGFLRENGFNDVAGKKEDASDAPDPNDPNDVGLMDRATLDKEFPTHPKENAQRFGVYDFRHGGLHIVKTPEKMNSDWQAKEHLRKVNALSHVHENLQDDDE